MKPIRFLRGACCALALLAGSAGAWAGGAVYGSIGIGIGGPAWGGPYYRPWPYYRPGPYYGPWPYYPRPYVYPPYYGPAWVPSPVIVAPAVPQVYIEQSPAPEVAESTAQYWYYCAPSRAYYPYVRDCPSGWQRVLPTPSQ